MAVAFICGFETGDASEVNSLGGGTSIQGTTVRTGAYAAKASATGVGVLTKTGLAATQAVIRFYLQLPSLPGGITNICLARDAGLVARLTLRFNAGNKLQVVDADAAWGFSTTLGTATFNTAQWYRMEMALAQAAGGAIKVWVDGTLDINITHTTDVTATPIDNFTLNGAATPNEYFFDDIRIDTGTLTPPGAGQIIARQGLTGAPTNNAWTKTGAATSALCWSDTPFSTATNCNSATSAAAQTMLVEKFSITQTGHGTQVVGAGDTVNAAKTAVIAKEATAGGGSIRRRVNGTDTDTAKSPATTDAYLDDGIWTTTVANLDLLEAGYVKSADANLTTVEDVWVIVDYTPAAVATFVPFVSVYPPLLAQ